MRALSRNAHLLMPAAVICIIVVMVVPMPPVMLDVQVTLDITLSVVILMVSMDIQQPVSFLVSPKKTRFWFWSRGRWKTCCAR